MSRNFPEISHSLLPLFDILLLFNWTIVVSLAIALPKGSQFGSGGLGYVSRYFSGGWKTEHPATWGASTKCNIDRRVRHFDIVLDYHFSHIAQPSTTARAVLHGPFDAHAYRMLMGACNLMVCPYSCPTTWGLFHDLGVVRVFRAGRCIHDLCLILTISQ